MERSEPTKKKSEPALVPEWLKGGVSSGVTGSGGCSVHHIASSSQSDEQTAALPTKNRSSVSSSDHDSPRSAAFADRMSSSYFRRSSSTNGSMMHDKEPSTYSRNYSSFSRSHRDRDWDKDLDFRLVEPRDRDYSDSLLSANTLTSKVEKDTLRRSQSIISGKRGEVRPRRVGNDLNNGLHPGGNIVSNKAAFDRDFPTLGAEEKQGVPDIGRVSSPGLSTASQSLPMGTLSVIGGDGWTSALAELPAVVGSNNTVLSSSQQTAPASSAALLPSMSTGLNMAETLAQAPSRARTIPQISVETQRLEELAIKQCRQLIPMTPSMSKNLVLNSSEKTKTKVARTGDLSTVAKVGQQPSSSQLLVNIRGSARSDTSKTSQLGKLHPLKGSRESNGVSSTPKDSSSPMNANRPSHGALRSPSNPKPAADLKLASSTVTQSSNMDRKPLPQAQNRIDFFNSLRKKTSSVNHSAAAPDSCPAMSSVPEKSDGQTVAIAATVSEGTDTPGSVSGLESLDWSTEVYTDVAGSGAPCKDSEIFTDEGEQNSGSDEVIIPDEEAAFLRRLGWEENAKYEALTEEEISAFYNEYKEKRPASNLCRRMQHSKILPLESHVGSNGGASSLLSSSNAASEM